ncbi:hypothetical protein CP916_30900 [Pseudomonas aeruginosa]|nr:hypothetical protein AO934_18175 [Pseudomonas aeruginosa]UAW06804.1 hypothetical protein [Pseudomonas phage PP9W]KSK12192.1 hypothetical protein APA08_09475 [Pseudomonas aeruginosa]KSQ85420.1 hypothetical protein APB42_28230 [Pseudomonas aeruginosa]PCM94397.1 hypothetical protein CP916_30900 [Pseudomonas aeruginosa]
MDCFICGAESTDSNVPDAILVGCPNCGSYRITRTALQCLENNEFRLDTDITREWLARQVGSGEIPLIDSGIAAKCARRA